MKLVAITNLCIYWSIIFLLLFFVYLSNKKVEINCQVISEKQEICYVTNFLGK